MASKKRTRKGSAGRTRAKKDTRKRLSHTSLRDRSTKRPRKTHRPQVRKLSLSKGERADIRNALQLVRKHVTGYEPDQFSMKQLDAGEISPRRIGTLKKRARDLRALLNSPHDLVKVPTRDGKPDRKVRHELFKFTHQKIRGAKHFIVHKPADNFTVSVVRRRVAIRGAFQGSVRGKRARKVVTETAFFLFEHTPYDEDDAVDMLNDMYDDMPEGFYVVLTGMHGDTGEPVEKSKLEDRLRDYSQRYQTDSVAVYDRSGNFVERRETDTGFIQAVTGFRYLSSTVDGMEIQMASRDARRRLGETANRKKRRAQETAAEKRTRESSENEKQKKAKRKRAAKKAAITRRRRKK